MATPRPRKRRMAKDSAERSRSTRPAAFVPPMAALLADALPEGAEWLYELKFDGYRALILKNGDDVRVRSRNNKELTSTYPTVTAAAARLSADVATVDGEVVALDETGRPSFQALQQRSRNDERKIVFYAFDLLNLEGEDLRALTLETRRERLRSILEGSGLLMSEELAGSAAEVVTAVRGLGLEGVIAKKRAAPYESGERSGEWVKLKLDQQQEFVVGGYRPGAHGVDALLIGVYENKVLRFAGKVRAGFVQHTRREVARKLEPLVVPQCPFPDLPDAKKTRWGAGVTADDMKEMRWVKPKLVVQIRFVQWTDDGRLRHAAFLGVRTDKTAAEVRRE